MSYHYNQYHYQVRRNPSATCNECGKVFDSQHPNVDNHHSLKQHMQVHLPRSVRCPACGEQRFRSGINAVQHIESGSCSACRGRGNARKQIHDFFQRNSATRQFLAPQITYCGDNHDDDDVPDFPYRCSVCGRDFHQASSMMQHMHGKHGLTMVNRLALK